MPVLTTLQWGGAALILFGIVLIVSAKDWIQVLLGAISIAFGGYIAGLF